MDLSDLPVSLRDKLEKRIRRRPEAAPVVDRLLAKRAAATSDEERAEVDRFLEQLVSPARRGWLFTVSIVTFCCAVIGYRIYGDRAIEHAVAVGVSTIARVERAEPGDCLFGTDSDRCLRLTVKLYPADGAPYVASFTQTIAVEWMSRVQPGAWLTVAVDPADPQKVTFDEKSMYVPPPTPPPSAP